MIGKYKEFEIYHGSRDILIYDQNNYYFVWSPYGYLTKNGEVQPLKGWKADTSIFSFPDIYDIENALSIFYKEPVKLDIIITRKILV